MEDEIHDDLMDISDTLYEVIKLVMESDVYLEWATVEKVEPFELESLLKFLSTNPLYAEDTEDL